MDKNYDYVFKIIIIGNSFVGKTQLLNCYANKYNNDIKYASTIGLDFYTTSVCIDNKRVAIQFWDTAGEERYRSLTSAYYHDAKGAFVLYDITNKQSFLSVDMWINDIKKICNEIIITIIGNKNDLDKMREIKKEDGEKKAKSFNAYFFEMSSLNKKAVNDVFSFIIYKIYTKNKNIFDENEDELEIMNENELKNNICC